MSPDSLPLTVAICTYNRALLLCGALTALVRQTAGTSAFEMLVVDNASPDTTRDVAEQFAPQFSLFTYLYEPKLGLSHARNAALHNAKGAWVCFLDDDALADPDYVAVALRECMNGRFLCFGGKVRPWLRAPLPDWFLEEYEMFEGPTTETVSPLPPLSFVWGGNMVINRRVALEAGGFNPSYGVCGNTLAYGEETDLQMRLVNTGARIGFVPDLVVQHYANPNKYTILKRLEIQFKAGNAWQRIRNDSSCAALCGILVKFFASPSKGIARSLSKLVKGIYRWQNVVIEVVGAVFFCAGRLSAWRAMRHDKRIAGEQSCPRWRP